MSTFIDIALSILVGLLSIALVGLVSGIFISIFWNWLMPTMFGVLPISYIEGWGLACLGKLLFGGGFRLGVSAGDK